MYQNQIQVLTFGRKSLQPFKLLPFRAEAVYLLLGVDVGGGEVVEHEKHLVLRHAVWHLHLL